MNTEPEAPASEKVMLSELDQAMRRLNKEWANLKTARKTWDLQSYQKTLLALSAQTQELSPLWQSKQEVWQADLTQLQAQLQAANYVTEIESALHQVGIVFQGEFPKYEFPPFSLHFQLTDGTIKLWLGKLQEKTTALHPREVAEWVSKRYKKVTEKKFDTERFLKELLAAYKKANQLTYREADVLWGKAAPLELLYDLLTLKQSAKKDYPKSLFIYELARLKEQFDMRYEGYQFELGFARNQERAFVLVDSHGKESRHSSLTIYQAEEE